MEKGMQMVAVILIISISFAYRTACYMSKCIKPGFKCTNCENLTLCIGDATDHFTQIQLNRCNNTDNKFCSVVDGGCVSDPRVCKIFGLQHIKCQNIGIFPDPHDCTTYHICNGNNGEISTKQNCPDGKAFDSLTKTCRHNLEHRVCKESPIPICVHSLQYGALPENPNIYYVCVQVVNDTEVRLYKCEDGKLFDTKTMSCVQDKNGSKNQSSFKCSEEGIFANANDCYRYFICDKNLKPVERKCRAGSHFNSTSKFCIKGTC